MSVMADMIGNREALDGIYLEATLSSLPSFASLTSTDAFWIFCYSAKLETRRACTQPAADFEM